MGSTTVYFLQELIPKIAADSAAAMKVFAFS
jgi:hypothetical protein